MIRQACLANNAWLNAFGSRNPIPPFLFAIHIFSHESQCTFRSPFAAPRQNFEEIEANAAVDRPHVKRNKVVGAPIY